MKITGAVAVVLLPAVCKGMSSAPDGMAYSPSEELDSLYVEQIDRASTKYGRPTWGPATRPPPFQSDTYEGYNSNSDPRAEEGEPTPSSSSSSYDYSYEVALSGFDGSITHYYVSYSDPFISGAVGVGHAKPTPTPTPVVVKGTKCDQEFPGLLSGLGIDIGLRLNLAFIGIDACVAL
ncbi:hypothetical protein H4R20_001878 [Coemansia guatemalensis]|uniref:Uncharacterized protein n=1 Tax=Coemansia guatemalensis TaxID=2761395 RepID=A0A9W8LUI6_9FUNG|nr:hypothetical protein H4R20_001878 [Coemansia guatemalensis]